MSNPRILFIILTAILLSLLIASCGSPTKEEQSLSLNLRVGQEFRMEIESRESYEFNMLESNVQDLTFREWELKFRVEKIEDQVVTLNSKFESIMILGDSKPELLETSDFDNIVGQSFTLTLNEAGEILNINGFEDIAEHFVASIDLRQRAIEQIGLSADEEALLLQMQQAEDEEALLLLDQQANMLQMLEERFAELMKLVFDAMTGEEVMARILQKVFIVNSSEQLSDGVNWTNQKELIDVFSETLSSENQFHLVEIQDTVGRIGMTSSAQTAEAQPVFDTLIGAAGLGFEVEMLSVTANMDGAYSLDLSTGLPIEGSLSMHAEGLIHVSISESLARQDTDELEPSPFTAEAEISFKRVN
jgi:hypothetical protein